MELIFYLWSNAREASLYFCSLLIAQQMHINLLKGGQCQSQRFGGRELFLPSSSWQDNTLFWSDFTFIKCIWISVSILLIFYLFWFPIDSLRSAFAHHSWIFFFFFSVKRTSPFLKGSLHVYWERLEKHWQKVWAFIINWHWLCGCLDF